MELLFKDRKRRIFFDMHLPELAGEHIADNFKTKDIVEEFSAANVDSVIAFAKCQFGHFYYDTENWHKHSGLGTQNFLVELASGLKKKNILTQGYYSVSWDETVADSHPDWLVEDFHGNKGNLGMSRWRTLCINSSYRELVKKQLIEIASLEELAGLWIDMTIIGVDCCFCSSCREKFKNRTGQDLYDVFENDKELFKSFRYDYIEDFYSEIYGLLRSINPNLEITNNYWGYPFSSYNVGSRAIGALKEADFVTGEAYTDWTGILAPNLFSRFLRAVGKNRPFEALIGRFINTWDFTRKPAVQLAYECYSVFSHGGTVSIDDSPYADGSFDKSLYRDAIKPIFSTIKDNMDTISGERELFSAIYHSQKTKDSILEEDIFIREIVGTFKMLYDLHYPLEFLFNDPCPVLEDLQNYACVFLPGVSKLSAPECRVFQKYIESGGIVISFGECGLLSVTPNPYGIENNGEGNFSLSFTRKEEEESVLLVRGKFFDYRSNSSKTESTGQLLYPVCENNEKIFYHNNLPSPGTPSNIPQRLISSSGKGELVVFTQPLGFHYSKYPVSDYRQLISETMEDLNCYPDIRIRAEKRIDHQVYQKDNVLYIHLMLPSVEPVSCCGLSDLMDGNFARPYEIMEDVQPSRGLEIILPSDVQVLKVESLIEGNPLTIEAESNIIKLDIISLWDIIKVEFQTI